MAVLAPPRTWPGVPLALDSAPQPCPGKRKPTLAALWASPAIPIDSSHWEDQLLCVLVTIELLRSFHPGAHSLSMPCCHVFHVMPHSGVFLSLAPCLLPLGWATGVYDSASFRTFTCHDPTCLPTFRHGFFSAGTKFVPPTLPACALTPQDHQLPFCACAAHQTFCSDELSSLSGHPRCQWPRVIS